MLDRFFIAWSQFVYELSQKVPYSQTERGYEGLFFIGLVFGLFIGIAIGDRLAKSGHGKT